MQNLIFVTHHKCGSKVLLKLLDRLAELNGLSFFTSHHAWDLPSADHDISLLTNADYRQISPNLVGSAVHVIRNPLNVLQSAYHSHLRTHPVDQWPELALQRNVLASVSKEAGMMLTLAFCERDDFYESTPGPLASLRRWDYSDERFATVRMEDYGQDMPSILRAAVRLAGEDLDWPSAEEFTFQSISGGRRPGEIEPASHYRSGHAATWREELPPAAIAYVRKHFRHLMETFYKDA